MTKLVVDALKSVKIEKHQRKMALFTGVVKRQVPNVFIFTPKIRNVTEYRYIMAMQRLALLTNSAQPVRLLMLIADRERLTPIIDQNAVTASLASD